MAINRVIGSTNRSIEQREETNVAHGECRKWEEKMSGRRDR